MSHFAIAVVTDRLDEKELAAKLQPFHEFECTGTNDQYVIDVDKTEDARAEYADYKTTKWRDSEGKIHDPYDDKYYRDPTPEEQEKIGPMGGTGGGRGISWSSRDWGDGKGYRAKVKMKPEEVGMEEVEIPATEIMSFAGFLAYWHGMGDDRFVKSEDEIGSHEQHKYGYVLLKPREGRRVQIEDNFEDEYKDFEVVRYVDRTNPNAKWDWWQIGGRYSGRFRVKQGAADTLATDNHGAFGVNPDKPKGGLDYVRIGDIDFDAMIEANKIYHRNSIDSAIARVIDRQEKKGITTDRETILADYKVYCEAKAAIPSETFLAYRNREGDTDTDFRDWYVAQHGENEDVNAYDRTSYTSWLEWELGTFKSFNVEDYLTKIRAFSAFAFLDLEGNWNEKGEMGWWGMVSDEKGDVDWEATFDAFVADLVANHPDKYLAVVDCHI